MTHILVLKYFLTGKDLNLHNKLSDQQYNQTKLFTGISSAVNRVKRQLNMLPLTRYGSCIHTLSLRVWKLPSISSNISSPGSVRDLFWSWLKKKIPKVKNILWFMGGAISQRIKSNMIYYYNKKYWVTLRKIVSWKSHLA